MLLRRDCSRFGRAAHPLRILKSTHPNSTTRLCAGHRNFQLIGAADKQQFSLFHRQLSKFLRRVRTSRLYRPVALKSGVDMFKIKVSIVLLALVGAASFPVSSHAADAADAMTDLGVGIVEDAMMAPPAPGFGVPVVLVRGVTSPGLVAAPTSARRDSLQHALHRVGWRASTWRALRGGRRGALGPIHPRSLSGRATRSGLCRRCALLLRRRLEWTWLLSSRLRVESWIWLERASSVWRSALRGGRLRRLWCSQRLSWRRAYCVQIMASSLNRMAAAQWARSSSRVSCRGGAFAEGRKAEAILGRAVQPKRPRRRAESGRAK